MQKYSSPKPVAEPKTRAKASGRKVRKSKDLSRCCGACAFFDMRNPSDTTCGLTGKSVERNDVCKRCNTNQEVRCQRCGKAIRQFSKERHYNAINRFEMTSNSGSSGQNMCLCRECSFVAWSMFQDLLEAIKDNRGAPIVNMSEN